MEADPGAILSHGWGRGRSICATVKAFGATLVDRLPLELEYAITIAGTDLRPLPGPTRVIHATWERWASGIVLDRSERGAEDDDQPLAGGLAGALAVSEVFQAIRGNALAARRAVGISLWRPDLPWRAAEARGPVLEILPARLWLLGLGHLGQANAWSLGCLPYPPGALTIGLVDPQKVVKANAATGLLTRKAQVGAHKARVVASALERRGVNTIIAERLFDPSFRPTADEPSVAFAGFDSPEPRRILEGAGFLRVVDARLGGGPQHYLDVMLHAFPSELSATTAFAVAERSDPERLLSRPAYVQAMTELEATGSKTAAEARCGVLEIARRTVGAAFVGAVASSLVIAEELRALIDGPRYEVVSLSLRSPEHVEAVANPTGPLAVNPGYIRL